jgi:preprotein translocase subunit SecD
MLILSRWKVIVVIAAILFGILFTLPNLLSQSMRDALPPFMPNKTLNLGLDLQGGSYLMLEVDTPALVKERSENLMEDVVKTLEDEGIRVANPAARQGGASVQIADPADPQAVGGRAVGGLQLTLLLHLQPLHGVEAAASEHPKPGRRQVGRAAGTARGGGGGE